MNPCCTSQISHLVSHIENLEFSWEDPSWARILVANRRYFTFSALGLEPDDAVAYP